MIAAKRLKHLATVFTNASMDQVLLSHDQTINLTSIMFGTTANLKSPLLLECLGNLSRLLELVSLMVSA